MIIMIYFLRLPVNRIYVIKYLPYSYILKNKNYKNHNFLRQDCQLVNARYSLTTNEIKFIMITIAQIKKTAPRHGCKE